MRKNGVLFLLLAALLVAVPAYSAWAAERVPDQSAYDGWWHPAIPPEKQAAFEKSVNEYREALRPLYNDMWAKQTELDYLSQSGKAEPRDVSRMVNDLKNIREKCQALHDDAAGKLAKNLGISSEHAYNLLGGFGRGGYGACGMGPGFSRGYGRGYGCQGGVSMGYGPRAHRGGYGGWYR